MTTTILDQIADERREAVAQAKAIVLESELMDLAEARPHQSLAEQLRGNKGKCVVAEVKKASPSAGVIRENFNPAEIAKSYEEHGAAGISVLTEPNHFLGSHEHLAAVRAVTDLPILRKDFIVDPYQVTETAAWGADVILLIVAMLEGGLIEDLYAQAVELGLDVLVESHNARELEFALSLPKAIIGVNNRDLKTLKTTLEPSRKLAKMIPEKRVSIAESGISSQEEISELAALGYNGFLIGESLLTGRFQLK